MHERTCWLIFAVCAVSLFTWAISAYGAEPKKRIVYLYTTAGCRPCQQAKRQASEWEGVELRTTHNCPAWVTLVPTFHWQDANGKWWQHAPSHWRDGQWSDRESERVRSMILGKRVEPNHKQKPVNQPQLQLVMSPMGIF